MIMAALATMTASGGALACTHDSRCVTALSSPADTFMDGTPMVASAEVP
jgi:hypothetical protein